MTISDKNMNYKIIDKQTYYRSGVFRHFSEDCKCSTSMTARINVTALKKFSEDSGTKFYINFLYILAKVLNSREDYRMGYIWQTEELICYDQINPHSIFFTRIRRPVHRFIPFIMQTITFSIRIVQRISEKRRRQENIF